MACALAPSVEGVVQPAPLRARLRRTRLCSYVLGGECKYGSKCDFAHTESELVPAPDFTNMHLCTSFLAGGCKRKRCRFAHGVQELQPGAFLPSAPPHRTRLSTRSAPFTPACLQPVKLHLPTLPDKLGLLGFRAAEPLASPLCTLEKPQTRLDRLPSARPSGGAPAGGPPSLCDGDDGDDGFGDDKTLTPRPRSSVTSAGIADSGSGLLQSSRDAVARGVPMRL